MVESMDSSQLPLLQLPSLSELESRMQVMRVSAFEETHTGETFSQRAQLFYQRRPLLLSLCQDLYDGYATLLDRFTHSPPQSLKLISHDITSQVSFQQMQVTSSHHTDIDDLVSKLVTANLEKDMAQQELQRRSQNFQEASKTIELLKKLVMLLDMEKQVAVEETANLGYKLASLLEENQELATEALFMKKEAVRLARCVLKMRDEHFYKVSLLEKQIYPMQSQREADSESVTSSPSCFGLDSNKNKSKKRKISEPRSEHGEKKRSKWLKRLNPFTKLSAPLHRAAL